MFPLRHCVTKMPNTTEMQAWMCCRNDVRVACQNRWFDHSPVPYETIRKEGMSQFFLWSTRSVSHISTSILVFGCVWFSKSQRFENISARSRTKSVLEQKKGGDQVWFNGHVFVTFDVSVWSTSNLQSAPGASFMTVWRVVRRRESLLEVLQITWSTEALRHWSTEPRKNTCDTHGFGELLPPWIIWVNPLHHLWGKCSRVPAQVSVAEMIYWGIERYWKSLICKYSVNVGGKLGAVEFRWFSGSNHQLRTKMNTVAVSRCALSVVHGIENFEKSICFIGKPSSHWWH